LKVELNTIILTHHILFYFLQIAEATKLSYGIPKQMNKNITSTIIFHLDQKWKTVWFYYKRILIGQIKVSSYKDVGWHCLIISMANYINTAVCQAFLINWWQCCVFLLVVFVCICYLVIWRQAQWWWYL
jgi:hypothetical protein